MRRVLNQAANAAVITHRLCRLEDSSPARALRGTRAGRSEEGKKVRARKIPELRSLGYRVELLPAPRAAQHDRKRFSTLALPPRTIPWRIGTTKELVEPEQPYRAPAKVGRNERSPCGSGKKFKKCCGG